MDEYEFPGLTELGEIVEATDSGTRLEQLRALARILAEALDKANGGDDKAPEKHSLAQLSRQYRETIREIEEIESKTANEADVIGEMRKRSPKVINLKTKAARIC